MADNLNWAYGHQGKGLLLDNGELHTWPVNPLSEDPHHTQYWSLHNLESQPAFIFAIEPNGAINNSPPTYQNSTGRPFDRVVQELLERDPHLRPPEQDDQSWALDPDYEDESHGPDYNFVLGAMPSPVEELVDFLAKLEAKPVSPHQEEMPLSPAQNGSGGLHYFPPGNEPEWSQSGLEGP